MPFFCHKCKKEVILSSSGRPSRTESCPKCHSDLHVCLNCKFHDRSAYNECKEPSADRVVDKNQSNFCDYFGFADRTTSGEVQDPAKDTLKKLDDLFK